MAAAYHGKPTGIMPDPLDMREIMFTNFLLVGFDPGTMESKHRIPFNRDMFALPNKKAMEVVMHFLFARLDPQVAAEEFRHCWPVRDKTKEQQFRKVCHDWVSRIVKEDPHACLPRIVQSLFHSPGGDRFYTFLFHFSSYVLQTVIRREHGKDVSIPPAPRKTLHNQALTRVSSKALHAHCSVQRKRFLEHTQYAVELQKKWQDFALQSTKENRTLTKKKRDLERKVKALARSKTDYQDEMEALQRTRRLQKVRDLWRGLDEFWAAQRPQREIVDSVLQGESNKYRIDAAQMQIQVPDVLLRECEEEIQKRSIENTYVGGKVNLLSLMQLWNISLGLLRDRIRKGPIPEFEQHTPVVTSAVHTHQAHLANTKAVRTSLQHEILPDLRDNVERLKSRLYSELEQRSPQQPQLVAPFNLGLGLMPPTPPMSFEAADTPVSQRFMTLHDTLRKSPESDSTPEVVQAWSQSLREWRMPDDNGPSAHSGRQRTPAGSTTGPLAKGTVSSRLPRLVEKAAAEEPLARKQKSQTPRGRPRTGPHLASRAREVTSGLHSTETPKARPGTVRTAKNKQKGAGHKKGGPRPDDGVRLARIQGMLEDKIVNAMTRDQARSVSRRSSQSSSTPSTPTDIALEDPLGNLDESVAFVSRDLIRRTPPQEELTAEVGQRVSGDTAGVTRGAWPGTPAGRGSLLETILAESEQQDTPQHVGDTAASVSDSPLSRSVATRTPAPTAGKEARATPHHVLPGHVEDLVDPAVDSPLSSLLVTGAPAPTASARVDGKAASVLDTPSSPQSTWRTFLSAAAHAGSDHSPSGDEPFQASPALGHTPVSATTKIGQFSLFDDDDMSIALASHRPAKGDAPTGHAQVSPPGDLFSRKEFGRHSFSPVNHEIKNNVRPSGFSNTLSAGAAVRLPPPTSEAAELCGEDDATLPQAAGWERVSTGPTNSSRRVGGLPPLATEAAELCGEDDATLPQAAGWEHVSTRPTDSSRRVGGLPPLATEAAELCGEDDATLPQAAGWERVSTRPTDSSRRVGGLPPLATEAAELCGEDDATLPQAAGWERVSTRPTDSSRRAVPTDLLERLQKIKLAQAQTQTRGAQKQQVDNTTTNHNDVIPSLTRLSLDLSQTPNHIRSATPHSSGQASPSSALSESYLVHSPTKPNEDEDVRTPIERIFTLGDIEDSSGGGFSGGQSDPFSRLHPGLVSTDRPSGSAQRKSARKSLEASFGSARKPLGLSHSFGTPGADGFWLMNEKSPGFADLLEDSPGRFLSAGSVETTPAKDDETGDQPASPAVGQLIDLG